MQTRYTQDCSHVDTYTHEESYPAPTFVFNAPVTFNIGASATDKARPHAGTNVGLDAQDDSQIVICNLEARNSALENSVYELTADINELVMQMDTLKYINDDEVAARCKAESDLKTQEAELKDTEHDFLMAMGEIENYKEETSKFALTINNLSESNRRLESTVTELNTHIGDLQRYIIEKDTGIKLRKEIAIKLVNSELYSRNWFNGYICLLVTEDVALRAELLDIVDIFTTEAIYSLYNNALLKDKLSQKSPKAAEVVTITNTTTKLDAKEFAKLWPVTANRAQRLIAISRYFTESNLPLEYIRRSNMLELIKSIIEEAAMH